MAENNVHLLLMLLNCTDRGLASLHYRVKQKQSYLRGIFMVRRWINNKMVINFGTVVKVRARNTYLCLAFVSEYSSTFAL